MNRALVLAAAVALSGAVLPRTTPADPPPRVIEVKMVDKSSTEFAFEPSRIEARQGDVIRFVQVGVMPHNVEFKGSPAGADIDDLEMGPYLTKPGQTYEIAVDGRFAGGEYPFVCTPHQFLGMTGTLVVEP